MRVLAACLTLLASASAAFADAVVESQRLHVRLDPASHRVEGKSELRVTLDGPGVVALELASELRITSILQDGAPVERIVDSERGDGVTVWRFPVTPAEGVERAIVSVAWSGDLLAPPGAKFTESTIDLPSSVRWAPTPETLTIWWLQLDVPEDLRCVLRAERATRAVSNGRAVETWTTNLPSRGLPIAAGPWTAHTADVAGTSVVAWGVAPDEALLRDASAAFERVAAILGPCPATRFQVLPDDALLASATPGFGATFWGDLPTQAARCWWGLGVPEPAGRSTWAQALALYTGRHLVVEGDDPAAALTFRREIAAGLSEGTAATDIGRLVLAFHALRLEIGDEAFFGGLRRLSRDRAGQSTTWEDWTAALSSATGRDLTARVQQWTERTGAPLLELAGVRLSSVGGRLRISGTIHQSLAEGEEPWRLTVPVVVEMLHGSERLEVEVGGTQTGFSAILSGVPVRATLDPEFQIPRRLARDDGNPLSNARTLLPDVDSAAEPKRVGRLLDELAGGSDARAVRRAVLDELRIAGLAVEELRSDVTVRSRVSDDVVTHDGTAISGCHPLTSSSPTPDGGVEVSGIETDEAADLHGKALLVDVPGSTRDVLHFARGFAGLAREAGALALLLRLPAHDPRELAPFCATPAEAPQGHPNPVLFAATAQGRRGADLAVPTLIVPDDFAPEGAFRVDVRWDEATTSVSSVAARIEAPNGRGAPLLLTAVLAPGEDASGAAALSEAAQLLQPHAALLGRDVVVSILPSGPAGASAEKELLRRLGDVPATIYVVSRVGDAGTDRVEILATNDAVTLAQRAVFSCSRTGLVALVNERDDLVTAKGDCQRQVFLRSAHLAAMDEPPDARKVTRIARFLALMLLDTSFFD